MRAANPVDQITALPQNFARRVVRSIPDRKGLQMKRRVTIPAFADQQTATQTEFHRIQISPPIAPPVLRWTVGPAVVIKIEVGSIVNAGHHFPRMVGPAIGEVGQPTLPPGRAVNGHIDIQLSALLASTEVKEIEAEIDVGPVIVAVEGNQIPCRIRSIVEVVIVRVRIERAQVAGRPVLEFLVPDRAAEQDVRILVGTDDRPGANRDGSNRGHPHRQQQYPPRHQRHALRPSFEHAPNLAGTHPNDKG